MTGIIDFALDRIKLALIVLIFAFVGGVWSYVSIPKEAEPDIQAPFVSVLIPLEGVSPEDAERLLARPAEAELKSVEGVKQMNTVTREGSAYIFLEFDPSFNVDQAVQDVKDKIDIARAEFPPDTDEPLVEEFNFSLFPVLTINLFGEAPERSLFRIAQTLEDKIETLPNVLEASVQGEREELLEIVIDPLALESYNVSYSELLTAVSNNNRLVPAGALARGDARFAVKVPGLIETAEDVFTLPIKRDGTRVVTLADVAEVRRTYKDRTAFAQFNGESAIAINVAKRNGANIIETVAAVRAIVDAESKTWPDSVRYAYTGDRSAEIFDTLSTLESSILTAILLVMILIVASLGLRTGLIVGFSIPASFMLTFLLLGVSGFTINMMVMFGLVIATGLIVDGAIVVSEFADRKMAEGLSPVEAYRAAGKSMFWPVISSTLTTLAAFIPFLFWNSIPGKFMSYLPITLIFTLAASLIMALIFVPVLGALFGKRPAEGSATARAISGENADPLRAPGFTGFYARFLRKAIRRPLIVTATAISAIFGVVTWYNATPTKVEFFLDGEPELLFVFVSGRGNLSPAQQFALVDQVEQRLRDIPGIEAITTTAGIGQSAEAAGDGSSAAPSDTIGRILIDVAPQDQRAIDGFEIERRMRAALTDVPGVVIEIRRAEQGPPQGKDIQINLRGANGETLLAAAKIVRDKLQSMPGLIEIDDTLPLPGIEWHLDVDRTEAAKFGADVTQVGTAVQLVTAGVLVGQYRPDDSEDEVDIRVRLPDDQRALAALDALTLATRQGPAPIGAFVTRAPRPRVEQIDRRDGLRIFEVRANVVEQGTAPQRIAEIRDWLPSANLPNDVQVGFGGADEESAAAGQFFSIAAIVVMFLMGAILLWQFNNIYHVLLTLFAVILSTVGAMIGFKIALPYISLILCGTGIVALAGIVVNNNIVLIDAYQGLRKLATPDRAALLAASQRLRPVLLTTITTGLGLAPMMFKINVDFAAGTISEGGPSADWWVPLSTTIVYGLGFATLLTLILTPVWLAVPRRLGALRRVMVKRMRGLLTGRRRVGANSAGVPAE